MEKAISKATRTFVIPARMYKQLSEHAGKSKSEISSIIRGMLADYLEELDDVETFKRLQKESPDGGGLLNEEEQKDFFEWLGVKKK
ncbi:MAG: hypothetical protein LBN06_11525 [Prevotellaceae bacterium]|jgi:hypothetical protein|nr:hypothetical protein [Prevotellaceae bacterium]